jgi:phospholipid:diacylglycerol acyltransferase
MSPSLRRRGGQTSPDSTKPHEEKTDADLNLDDNSAALLELPFPQVDVHAEVVKEKPRTRKRRNMFIFLLGSLSGIVAAGFFASTNDLIDFPEFSELSLDTVLDALPAGMVRDYRDLVVRATVLPVLPGSARHPSTRRAANGFFGTERGKGYDG